MGAEAWLLVVEEFATAPSVVPTCPRGIGVLLANVQVGLSSSWDLPASGHRQGSEHRSPYLQNKDKSLSKGCWRTRDAVCQWPGIASAI